MDSLTVTNARKNLYKLIEETAASHQPVEIIGKSANAVLVSEADWEGINETLHLLSIPGMRESITERRTRTLGRLHYITWLVKCR